VLTRGRALVAMLRILGDRLWKTKFEEFKKLVASFGYEIVSEIVQAKDKPRTATLFGKGKIMEMKQICDEENIDIVIVYNTLKSIQKLNLEIMLERPVIDRYELTLEIFAENASDSVSKLQIELAKIEKEIPYIKLQTSVIHQRDRPFTRAGGEYGYVPKLIELRKRRKRLIEKIEEMRREKINQIIKRKEMGFNIVTIVGYYNAGKTSLFNMLTGANKKVSDTPFTTLESKYSALPKYDNILLVDTIGFVLDLDPKIIKSFEINVDDMRYADCLLLTIDISESTPIIITKINTVIQTLKQVNALNKKPIIIAANKIDLVKNNEELNEKINTLSNQIELLLKNSYPIIPVSAKKKIGIDKLAEKISETISLLRNTTSDN